MPKRPSPPKPVRSLSFWKYSRFSNGFSSSPTSLVSSPIKKVTDALPNGESTAVAIGKTFTDEMFRPVISWPGLVLACMVCLLLGSLLRSLLSEADFVIYLPAGQNMGPGAVGGGSGAGTGTWRELKRLMEWRIGWKRDLLLGIARRA